MTEPQVWTMIALFTTLMFGMLTVVSTLFVRVLRTEVGGLRAEMNGGLASLRAETTGGLASLRADVNGEIGGLRAEVRGLHTRMDSLDRDVQALVKRTFGLDRD